MNLAPSAAQKALASIEAGQRTSLAFAVSADEMAAFAALSGDYNPLHSDAAFAAARGFAGRVVYGALLVAKLSRLIGMELPGRDALWTGLDIQFVAPLLVGEEAVLEAVVAQVSPATKSMVLQVSVKRNDRVLARGKASVSMRDGA
ncbi:MAG: (R)-hydratase [Alphaproteobacteria bacterium]|nr:(R)-hydratase [Alphaproteobacteria bacterium]